MKKLIFKAHKQKIWRLLNNLKQKVVQFDIKPAKSTLAEKLQSAEQFLDAGDYVQGEKILYNLLLRHPNNLSVIEKLLQLYDFLGARDEELKLAKYAVRIFPNDYALSHNLGAICAKNGKYRNSAKYYKQALKLRPEAPSTKHLMLAASGINLPQPDPAYVKYLFDSYAENFDQHLVEVLEYKAHKKLAKTLQEQINIPTGSVVDLGCGTGLLGQVLKEQFAIGTLVGVDLSEKMLQACNSKKLYDDLQQQDFVTYMQAVQPGIDLIVSSDALTYLGDLEPIFAHSQRTLNHGGFLAFTVEKGRFGTYKLRHNGRYQHSPAYIKSLYKRYLFSKMYARTIELRKESGNMVAGYLVLIQK